MSRSDGGGNWCVRAHEPASSSVRLEEVRLTLVTIPLGKTRISLSLSLGSCIHKKCTHGSCISTCHVDNGVCLFIFNSYGTRSRRVNTIFVTSRVRCWSRRVQGRVVVLSQSRRCYSAWVVSFGPSGANRWFYECGIRSLPSSRGSLLESWRVKQPMYVRPRPSDLTLGRPDQVCMLNAHTYSSHCIREENGAVFVSQLYVVEFLPRWCECNDRIDGKRDGKETWFGIKSSHCYRNTYTHIANSTA